MQNSRSDVPLSIIAHNTMNIHPTTLCGFKFCLRHHHPHPHHHHHHHHYHHHHHVLTTHTHSRTIYLRPKVDLHDISILENSLVSYIRSVVSSDVVDRAASGESDAGLWNSDDDDGHNDDDGQLY